MSKEIKYDFLLSIYIEKELENIYEQYEKTVFDAFADDIQLIKDGWQGEFADAMFKKADALQNEFSKIGEEILAVNEELKQLTKRLRIMEENAKIIASDNQEK